MKSNEIALLDANVLYPAPLRDLLINLGALAQKEGMFRLRCTNEIHAEWKRKLAKNRPDLDPRALYCSYRELKESA